MPNTITPLSEVLDDLRPRFRRVNTALAAPSDKTAVAHCDNCGNIPKVKDEMWRIRRELKALLTRIDKLILSQD